MIRHLLPLILSLYVFLPIAGQNYVNSASISKKALVYYSKDNQGFYQKQENVSINGNINVQSIYGYDKKSHELYVETDNANCVVTVQENYHKYIKKNKTAPILKTEDLILKAKAVNEKLAARFENLNNARRKHILDSLEQVKQDSIRKAREDSLREVAKQNKLISYKKKHLWPSIPTKEKMLYCDYCEKSIETGDSIICYKIKNDTIYWRETKWGHLTIPYKHIHYAKIPETLKRDEDYQYHFNAFKDSLENKLPSLDTDIAAFMNLSNFEGYLKDLKKEAPNGFFLDWGWDDEYSSISFHFNYMNTNKNTIKYIEVFFVVTNDVGDVRKRGSFRGTGPLAEWESASWNWDHSSYYVAGDATNMNISQVIITYMNGSRVTIPKSKLHFD